MLVLAYNQVFGRGDEFCIILKQNGCQAETKNQSDTGGKNAI